MIKSYGEVYKEARYKLPGNGPRSIQDLLEAFENIESSVVSPDIYGSGDIINDFEAEIAKLLGKEKAVFFPSGTMAQQIALRMWSDRSGVNKVAYHPLCHLEIHEKDGLKVLHHLESILLGDKGRLFTIEDLESVHQSISALLIELPQREIGGQLPSYEELMEISKYCKSKGIKLHLDGARLFESLPFYDKNAEEICSLFDSVYVSFYKGLGGIAGAVLAGDVDFIEESKIWKRRHGGDLISLYPYIVSAKYSLDKRYGKMKDYWQHALTSAKEFNKIKGVKTIPQVPVCNMFHVHFDFTQEQVESAFAAVIEKCGVGLISNVRGITPNGCYSELSFGDSFELIPEELLNKAFDELDAEFTYKK